MSDRVVMRIEGHAGGQACPVAGQYLVSYDPDEHDGLGDYRTTPDLALAKKYGSVQQALEHWRQTSSVRPWRADGKPNRPLTVFSVSVMSESVARKEDCKR